VNHSLACRIHADARSRGGRAGEVLALPPAIAVPDSCFLLPSQSPAEIHKSRIGHPVLLRQSTNNSELI
jgi:hypothetical protein